MEKSGGILSGEYSQRGEYHKQLDPGWSYYPIYVRKMAYVDEIIGKVDNSVKILDAGCGEGVLVEKYKKQGRDITGIDLNVSNEYVVKGDILNMPFVDGSFDIVLFLDVIEHFDITKQPLAITELKRVLKKGGKLIISIPNLAHKASRIQFHKTGDLIRTAHVNKHPGDRPIKEYIGLIRDSGFLVEKRLPIKLTMSPACEKVYRLLMGSKRFERYIYSSKRNPDDCFLNIFVLRK